MVDKVGKGAGFLPLICCIGFFLLLIPITIVLSLIPVYLTNTGSNIDVNNNDLPSVRYQASYGTNLENGNRFDLSDISLLSESLRTQLRFSQTSQIQINLSKFLPLSTATITNRRKREDQCNQMKGDRYNTEIVVSDPMVYRTEFSREKFNEKISSNVQRYTSLVLPFKFPNGTIINVVMVLCQFGRLFQISSTCTDGIQNQDETDIDCGGIRCTNRCSINQTCSNSSDCHNTTCVNGICLEKTVTIVDVCQIIRERISSSSGLFYPLDLGYNQTIKRYGASSVIPSTCSVEPGDVNDVSIVLKIIGQYRIPFGLNGGGHSLNPGFSSSTGIQISMRRFQQVVYHSNNQTVDVGSGLIWDDVYAALAPYNVSVLGGRVSGVGVAGLTLGGGYTWKTNQYGLTVDHVFDYQLVSPNGTIVHVNQNSYPDIFFGLKGGFNNFGIVTNFQMRAFPQTFVYGGVLFYIPFQFPDVIQAIVNFQANNRDPRAQLIGSFIIAPGQFLMILILGYDAPIAPNGTFDAFVNIPHLGSLQTLPFLAFVKAAPVGDVANLRGRFSTVSITNLTSALLYGMLNEIITVNATVGSKLGVLLSYNIQTFLPTYLDNSQGGAFPHVPSSIPVIPFDMQFSWASPLDDQLFLDQLQSTSNTLFQIALSEGQDIGGSKGIIYPNYALDNTPLAQMYGDNIQRLRNIRKSWDPNDVMYLTGGFKF